MKVNWRPQDALADPQQSRLADGTRKITHIMEVTGFDGDRIRLEPIFEYVRKGYDANGKITGFYRSTGYVPKFYLDCIDQGAELDLSLFGDAGTADIDATVI